MDEEAQKLEEQKLLDQKLAEEKKRDQELIRKILEGRGQKQISWAEYQAMQAKKAKKKSIKIPLPVKATFSAPLLVIFICGIFVIPYTIYLISTGEQSEIKPGAKGDILPKHIIEGIPDEKSKDTKSSIFLKKE